MAEARSVPVRFLSVACMVILAVAVAEAVRVVGMLLIFALLVTPTAIAERDNRASTFLLTLTACAML